MVSSFGKTGQCNNSSFGDDDGFKEKVVIDLIYYY